MKLGILSFWILWFYGSYKAIFGFLRFHLKMVEQQVEMYYCLKSSKMSVVGFSLLLPVIKCSVKFNSKRFCDMDRRKYFIQ